MELRSPSYLETLTDRNALAVECCQIARELEDAGQFEDAQAAIGVFWAGIGDEPDVYDLNSYSRAEVLLRAGVLTARIGSTRQTKGALELGNNLITRSLVIFDEIKDSQRIAECYIGIARCYRHEGRAKEARDVLRTVLDMLGDNDAELKARAILVLLMVETESRSFHDALQIEIDSEDIFAACQNHTLQGSYYNEFALTLQNIAQTDNRPEYFDQALEKLAAASFHFEEAGHVSYSTRVESNIGYHLLQVGRYAEAHKHLTLARLKAERLKDKNQIGIIDETRASVFLAEGQNDKAEKAIRSSLRALQGGNEGVLLAESLTTQGKVLARLGKLEESVRAFHQAIDVSNRGEDTEGAGRAWLTMLEELHEHLTDEQKVEAYTSANDLLSNSQDSTIGQRLAKCAQYLIRHMGNSKKKINWEGFSLRDAVREYEAYYIEQAMKDAGGNIVHAAKLLGLASHQTLSAKLNKLPEIKTTLQAVTVRRSIIKEEPSLTSDTVSDNVRLMPGTLQLRLIPGVTASDLLVTHQVTSYTLKELDVYPGDLIVVKVGDVEAGELVGAFVDNEQYAVGKLSFEDAKVILSMDSPDVAPQKFDEDKIEIEGRIVGYCKADEVRAHREATRRKQGGLLRVYPI